MDLKRSVRVALALHDHNMMWLAEQLGISRMALYKIVNRKTHHHDTLKRLADVFDMPVSKFIELGEKPEAA